MAISPNPLKATLAVGRVQIGTWINLVRNPAILTLFKSAGLDYVLCWPKTTSVRGAAISAAARHLHCREDARPNRPSRTGDGLFGQDTERPGQPLLSLGRSCASSPL